MIAKKAQGMSLNVIIIAVLALIVLVVLVVIFAGKAGQFSNSTGETGNQYAPTRCDIPGTLRYCAYSCDVGDSEVKMQQGFTCTDSTKGSAKCCSKI